MQHSTSCSLLAQVCCSVTVTWRQGESSKQCLNGWPVSAGQIWLSAEHTLSPQSSNSWLPGAVLPGSPSPAAAAWKAFLERGSWWEAGFAWQDAKTARAVVGFTAGSGLGKSLRQCRNPFFQVPRLKETCN